MTATTRATHAATWRNAALNAYEVNPRRTLVIRREARLDPEQICSPESAITAIREWTNLAAAHLQRADEFEAKDGAA